MDDLSQDEVETLEAEISIVIDRLDESIERLSELRNVLETKRNLLEQPSPLEDTSSLEAVELATHLEGIVSTLNETEESDDPNDAQTDQFGVL